MLNKTAGFLSTIALNLGSLVLLWGLLMLASYCMIRWSMKQVVSWPKTVRLISIVIGAIAIMTTFLALLPHTFATALSMIIVPNCMCAISLHALLLAVDRYLRYYRSAPLAPSRLVAIIIGVYVVLLLLSLALIRFPQPIILRLFQLFTSYLSGIALMGILSCELITGRGQKLPKPDLMSKPPLPDPDDYREPW